MAESPHQLIAKDKVLKKIFTDTKNENKTYSNALLRFYNYCAECCQEINESMITGIQCINTIAKTTNEYPGIEIEVETSKKGLIKIKSDLSHTIIDPIEAFERKQQRAQEMAVIEYDEAIEDVQLQGNTEFFESFSQVLTLSKRTKLGQECWVSFMQMFRPAYEFWNVEDLLIFYLKRGKAHWLSPVVELERLYSKRYSDREKSYIVDNMANAGILGFCPTQFLKRVLLPHLQRFKITKAEENINDFFQLCLSIHKALQTCEGDGSAANIFSLKEFIEPMANPLSKLYQRQFYVKAQYTQQEVYDALIGTWHKMFKDKDETEKRHIRYFYRGCISEYFKKILSIENPWEIQAGFTRAIENFLAAIKDNTQQLEEFDHIRHAEAIHECLRYQKSPAQQCQLLEVNIEIAVKLLRGEIKNTQFINYTNALRFGSIQSAEAIDAYFYASRQISELVIGSQAQRFLNIFIKDALDTKQREEMMLFIEKSGGVSPHLYSVWKGLKRDKEGKKKDEELLFQQASELNQQFLYSAKTAFVKKKLHNLNTNMLETEFMFQYLKNCQNGLNQSEPKALEENPILTKHKNIEVIVRNGIQEQNYNNKNLAFLRERANAIAVVKNNREDCKQKAIDTLFMAAITFAKNLKQEFELFDKSEDKKEQKRAKGLKQQMKGPMALLEFISLTTNSKYASLLTEEEASLIKELAVMLMGQNKTFHKDNNTDYAILACEYSIRTANPESLTEMPYKALLDLKKDQEAYTIQEVEMLNAFYSFLAADYFTDFSKRANTAIEKLKSILIHFYKANKIQHLYGKESAIVADFFARSFTKYQGINQLHQEQEHLLKKIQKDKAPEVRKLTLFCAKQKIDNYFGDIGQNCTSGKQLTEIKRPIFHPMRMIDVKLGRIIGYNHLLEIKKANTKVLMIAGFEPRDEYMTYVDPFDLYVKLKRAIIEYAQEIHCDAVVLAENPTAHSNRYVLQHHVIERSIMNKPIIKYNIEFPNGMYSMQGGIILWQNGKVHSQISSDGLYTENTRDKYLFYS